MVNSVGKAAVKADAEGKEGYSSICGSQLFSLRPRSGRLESHPIFMPGGTISLGGIPKMVASSDGTPKAVLCFFGFLFDAGTTKSQTKRWRLAIGAAMWTIWLARNDATFKNKKWSSGEILFIIKLRSWHWAKSLNSLEDSADSAWWMNPGMNNGEGPIRAADQWKPPEPKWLKFNTDAAVNRGARNVGIGGVLRDSNGKVIALFSIPCQYDLVEKVELEAIRIALSKAMRLKTREVVRLIIESDSTLAVGWCLTPVTPPLMYEKTFVVIDKAIREFDEVVIQHIPREMNTFADSLAKMGRERPSEYFFMDYGSNG